MLSINLFRIIPPEKRTSRMDEYSKNEILFSEAIGVCRVADILNLSTPEKQEIAYVLQKDKKEQVDA